MDRFIMRIFIILLITLLCPLLVFAGIDDDFNKNLNKSKCIKSWKHTASVFKLYFNADYCNQGEPTAALMTIRYIYEANHTKFPKKIEVDYGNGIVDSYPFTNIPSLK